MGLSYYVQMPTSSTPYSLVYDNEVIFLIKVKLPSLRVSLKHIFNNEEYKLPRLHELEFLDERNISALNHLQSYQNILNCSYKNIKN